MPRTSSEEDPSASFLSLQPLVSATNGSDSAASGRLLPLRRTSIAGGATPFGSLPAEIPLPSASVFPARPSPPPMPPPMPPMPPPNSSPTTLSPAATLPSVSAARPTAGKSPTSSEAFKRLPPRLSDCPREDSTPGPDSSAMDGGTAASSSSKCPSDHSALPLAGCAEPLVTFPPIPFTENAESPRRSPTPVGGTAYVSSRPWAMRSERSAVCCDGGSEPFIPSIDAAA